MTTKSEELGIDEELKELLLNLERACELVYVEDRGYTEMRLARSAIFALFERAIDGARQV